MADLTIETAWTCGTNESWETQVPASAGGTHTVRWGRLFGRDAQVQGTLYGYTCSCPAFTKSRRSHLPCKHIMQVAASGQRCGWNETLEPTLEASYDAQGEPCCPDCGGPLGAWQVGV
jgi:hypothetical protein